MGIASINRQIQKYVANHNKDGPKTKVKMKKFLTALSSVLYFMFYFPPYVLYGKPSVHIEKDRGGGGKSTLISQGQRALWYHLSISAARPRGQSGETTAQHDLLRGCLQNSVK